MVLRREYTKDCPSETQVVLILVCSDPKRIDSHPELKVAVSCPFRAQGAGAQLPAFPTSLVSTQTTLWLPPGHEPVTPHHDETTCQCSLSDS